MGDNEDAYIHAMFASICDNVRFGRINMSNLRASLLMKSVFCNNKHSNIKFDILSLIFPNIAGYFIDLVDVEDKKEAEIESAVKETESKPVPTETKKSEMKKQIIFNSKLVKILKQLKNVQSIKFFGVDEGIETCQEFKEYATLFDGIGWSLRTCVLNDVVTLSIDCKMKKD